MKVPLFDLALQTNSLVRVWIYAEDGNSNEDYSDWIYGINIPSSNFEDAKQIERSNHNSYYDSEGPIDIDGNFEDWHSPFNDIDLFTDDFETESTFSNVDLDQYATFTFQDESYFYMRVQGDILSGKFSNSEFGTENSNFPSGTVGVSNQDSSPLPVKTREDTIYIFLDLNGEIPYGYQVNDNFFASHMIEIKGTYGSILSSSYYNFTSMTDFSSWDWSLVSNVKSASDADELECMLENLPNEYRVHMHLVSWNGDEDNSTSFLVQNEARGPPSYGTETGWSDGSVDDDQMSAVFDSSTGKVVIAYADFNNGKYGTAVVGTLSGLSVSFGTEVVFNSGVTQGIKLVYDSSNEKVVLAYIDEDYSPAYSVIVKVGTVSGTSISFGSGTALDTAGTISGTFDSSNNKVVLAYEASNGDCSASGCAIVGTVSGTSISFGTVTEFDDGGGVYHGAVTFDSNSNKVVIAYPDQDDSGKGRAIVGTVSGTSISFGSVATFNTDEVRSIAATFDTSNNKVVIAYRDTGNSDYGTAIVGTVSGTSITFGSKEVFKTSYTTEMAQITFIPGYGVLVGYCADGEGEAVFGTVSGTSISFDNPTTFEDGGCSEGTMALYDSENGNAIIIYEDSGDSNEGKARVAEIPEFSSIFFPILSTLLVVGFKFRIKKF